jgi:hypothetical protein
MATKIRLDLDALDVQSFTTSARLHERGTVRGNACSESTCFERLCGCTDLEGNCVATAVNCSGGGGTGGTGGPADTFAQTCATGHQRVCSCGV